MSTTTYAGGTQDNVGALLVLESTASPQYQVLAIPRFSTEAVSVLRTEADPQVLYSGDDQAAAQAAIAAQLGNQIG